MAAPSGLLPCRRGDCSVVFMLSCKGLIRNGLYQFLASSSSQQHARPRRDRRPSGARCSTAHLRRLARELGYDSVPSAHWKIENGSIKKIANGQVPRMPNGRPAAAATS